MEKKRFTVIEEAFLGGAIVLQSTPDGEDPQSRYWHSDARGEVAVVLDGTTVDFLEYAEFAEPGVKRGHHYHKAYTEYLYLLSGEITVLARRLDNGEGASFKAVKGDMIVIQPMVGHGFISLTRAEVLTMGSGSNPFTDRTAYTDFEDLLKHDEGKKAG
jgi:dTDP-4-dehydrorhamnose 3,5-epimerase-like enzyme